MAVENAINIHDWVFETDALYTEDGSPEWQRGNTRFVRDDAERMWRYSAGDLSYPVAGFQRFQSMGGVAVTKDFTLQPYRITEPTGDKIGRASCRERV